MSFRNHQEYYGGVDHMRWFSYAVCMIALCMLVTGCLGGGTSPITPPRPLSPLRVNHCLK